jgi:glycosyltransferase involved in cell wall biosynthesis
MKILLTGHACGPNLGSEPGFTWNWALQLSLRHRVWAIVHPHHKAAIDKYLSCSPTANLTFEYVTLPRYLDPWRFEAGEKGLRLHYIFWQHAALRAARRLHGHIKFDLSHHVSWGTVGAVPLLWKLPIPFFWGPIGGAQVAPRSFRTYFGKDRLKQTVRTARLRLTSASPHFRRALRNCALILATNNETKELLEAAGAKTVKLFLDGGVAEEWLAEPPQKEVVRSAPVVMHWCGRLEPRKGLSLAIEALAAAGDVDVQVEVSGRGPERDKCAKLASDLGVADKVKFLGFLTHEAIQNHLRRADALLVTSLCDSFGSVALEAAAQGLPIIALDHQGIGSLLPSDAGWKVPVTNPPETVAALANAIREAACSPKARLERSAAALKFARSNTWDQRARQMEAWYEQYR